MQTLTKSVYKLASPGSVFDETVVRNLFPSISASARKVLVHRAIQKGEVLRLKPGLYCLAEPYRKTHLHPFALAGMLHAPSHVSLESALSYHGLLPEAVFQVASVTSQRSRTFKTPLGIYSYHRVPANFPRAGVKSEKLDRISWAFIASPLRAITDLIYLRRHVSWKKDGLGFLVESMRMESDELNQISFEHFEEIHKSIRNKRVKAYLEGMRREIET
jgi:predicted transcriptional regulator of viral defense system